MAGYFDAFRRLWGWLSAPSGALRPTRLVVLRAAAPAALTLSARVPAAVILSARVPAAASRATPARTVTLDASMPPPVTLPGSSV